MKNITWAELIDAYNFMKMMNSELSDWMQCSLEEWFDAVKELNQTKKETGTVDQSEINSVAYWLNDICREDGMPGIFEELAA